MGKPVKKDTPCLFFFIVLPMERRNKKILCKKGVSAISRSRTKLTKDNFDERLKGNKSYQTSRNLDRPFEIRGAEAELLIEGIKLSEMRPVYIDGYMSKHNGGVIYREYNLMRSERN